MTLSISCARSKPSLGCLLYLAQSGALDHGLTVRTSADVLDLLKLAIVVHVSMRADLP